MKIAINGFGRIGRAVTKIAIKKNIDIVAINDLADPKTLSHLLKYDSAYGKFDLPISYDENSITIKDKNIKILSEKNPLKLPWKELDVDIVVESTGLFTKGTSDRGGYLDHIVAGAKKVLLSVPAKDKIGQTIVMGVNDGSFDITKNSFSNASCTTNCLAPVANVINSTFGIKKGFMTTTHAYTSDQVLIDRPHSDLRRGRAASKSIIPTTTGATIAVEKVIPDLIGKLDGVSLRVPIITGSLVDFTAILEKKTNVSELNEVIKKASERELKGILEYSVEPLVSVDIIKNTHSGIFDSLSTQMIGEDFVKIIIWYDNEWGYSNRVVELAQKIGREL